MKKLRKKLTAAERSARYRAKDVDAYRKRKRELAKTPKHRRKRKEYARLWRKANRKPRKTRVRKFTDAEIKEHRRDASLAYRIEHREELRKKSTKYYRKNRLQDSYKLAARKYHLRKKYGITIEQYNAIFASQGSKCAICGHNAPKNKRGWHLDHCHDTGRVRGILCHVCNTKLGWYQQFKDEIEAYLK